jgi:hypothetical protein
MKSALILLMGITIFAASCSKSSETETNEVWIRVENATSILMNEIKISDVQYNNLNSSSTSDYKLISFPIYAANCSFKVNGQDAWAGYLVCGTPMPPSMEPGYYTFKVGNTTTPNYYSIEVRKK